MRIKGILFDINGTLIDIYTDENYKRIYKSISNFLSYYGVFLHHADVRREYFAILREQRRHTSEPFPEFDANAVWREFLSRRWNHGSGLCPSRLDGLPGFLTEMFRSISRRKLKLYPGVREVLEEQRHWRRLAALTDGQRAWAVPEMRAVGIEGFFDPIVVSGDYGYRKPDRRLFEAALHRLGLAPWEVLFVGNDMYRDVYGPKQLGIRTVFFDSNQGRKSMDGVEPDYIIRSFPELRNAVDYFERTH